MPGALTRQGEPAGAPLAAVLIVLAVLGFVVALNVTSTTPGDEPATGAGRAPAAPGEDATAGGRTGRAAATSGEDAAAGGRAGRAAAASGEGAGVGADAVVAATSSPAGLSPVAALPRLTVAARRRATSRAARRPAARPRAAQPRPVVTASPTPAGTPVAPAATVAPRPAPAATVAPRPAPVRTAAPRPAQPDFDSSGGFDSSG
ncbi:hypothetical protein C8N24_6528 [Solirubrobacter pauli]|uniref:Uncharacterized protein n=1 Tax=Solirubrobacter pauli TaxID=166793 RepID=A0A660L216_9ACTN|nr:hypothetical protein [Solirubrobacter pauli]RKQ84897.1 hypothetical protein C8N24_6528 [Solirubrobacter pauli]